MEKLIALLNKFEIEAYPKEHEHIEFEDGTWTDGNFWFKGDSCELGEKDGLNYSGGYNYRDENSELVVISKQFGFIKWLVENEKIDIDKMEEKSEYTFLKKRGGEHIIEDVLMLLSIQDEPIEFLVSILK